MWRVGLEPRAETSEVKRICPGVFRKVSLTFRRWLWVRVRLRVEDEVEDEGENENDGEREGEGEGED